jgi:hypothetical protein
MSWLNGLTHRVRTLLLPGAHARHVDDEMRFRQELDASRDPVAAASPR